MKPVMYIFANRGLNMSSGKLAAQVAHAAVRSFRLSHEDLLSPWLETGETKLVMLAEDAEHLFSIREYLNNKDYASWLVIDEGRTEIRPHSPTALGVELVDKDLEKVLQDFADFKVYKEPNIVGKKKRKIPNGWKWNPRGE